MVHNTQHNKNTTIYSDQLNKVKPNIYVHRKIVIIEKALQTQVNQDKLLYLIKH